MPASVSADICIIGAGAAGITLANELTNSDLKVVLVESGGLESNPAVQDLYSGTAVGPTLSTENNYLQQTRLRYFGGTTNHWTGWCWPLRASDFTQSLRNDRMPPWPISLQDLVPFYQRASRYLDIPFFLKNPTAKTSIPIRPPQD